MVSMSGRGVTDGSRGRTTSAAPTRKRYAAVVEKGESAWRREWGGFISGLTLKRLHDGNTVAVLKGGASLEDATAQRSTASDGSDGGNDGSSMGSAATFAYLFSSPAERKAARKKQQQQQQQQQLRRSRDESDTQQLSRHQQAVLDAERRGLQLACMTRKQKRDFLRLTRNAAEEQAAATRARGHKLHELMDAHMAWYQQGPYPVDLIAEKLVMRKAEKKGRQLQLRYNYLLPHPSWLARRAQHRREAVLAGLGRRFVFDDNGDAYDALHHRPVDLARVNLLLHRPLHRELSPSHDSQQQQQQQPLPSSSSSPSPPPQQQQCDAVVDRAGTEEKSQQWPASSPPPSSHSVIVGSRVADTVDDAVSKTRARNMTGKACTQIDLLVNPQRVHSTYVRAVAANRAAAMAIQQANLSTSFLSARLVHVPRDHAQSP